MPKKNRFLLAVSVVALYSCPLSAAHQKDAAAKIKVAAASAQDALAAFEKTQFAAFQATNPELPAESAKNKFATTLELSEAERKDGKALVQKLNPDVHIDRLAIPAYKANHSNFQALHDNYATVAKLAAAQFQAAPEQGKLLWFKIYNDAQGWQRGANFQLELQREKEKHMSAYHASVEYKKSQARQPVLPIKKPKGF